MSIQPYREVAVLLLVSIAAVNDLATRRIPNRLLLAGLAGAGALCLMAQAVDEALLAALGGLAAGLAVLLPFYLLRGMAAGDVKLMAVVGAFTGLDDVLHIAVLTWCVGGAMALLVVIVRGRLGLAVMNLRRMLAGISLPGVGVGVTAVTGKQSAGAIPYGVAIAIGTVLVLASHYG